MASSKDISAYEELNQNVYSYGSVSLALAMAYETGIIGVLCNAKTPLSSQQVAETGKLKERYTRELLNALAVAGLTQLEKGTGGKDGKEPRYWVPEEHRNTLYKTGVYCLGISATARHFEKVSKCFPLDGPNSVQYDKGHGVDMLDEWGKVSVDNNTAAILKTPGLKERFEKGIKAAEVGCGSGRMACHLAAMFPNSHFTATDLTPEAIDRAKKLAHEMGLANMTFDLLDLSATPDDWRDKFDWLFASEMMHHVPNPLQALKNIYKALKPGGHFSLLDEFVSSYVADNVGNKDAAALYSLSSMMCIPEIDASGEGHEHALGPCWGEEKARELVAQAGFKVLGMIRSGTESMGSSGLLMCQKPA